MEKIDEQASILVKQWGKEDRQSKADILAEKARESFPEATIVPLPDAIIPSVMIIKEAPSGASDAIKALGTELRITWELN